MPALTDYFKGETFSYYEMAKEIAKLHLLFKKAGVKKGDKIALIGRNNPRWCITYIATISYGAVIVPILQDFAPADIIHIINHSESKLLFLGDNFWDIIEEDQIRQIEAVFSLTDFHAIYERNGKALTKFQRDILKNYRSKYPRGFSVNDIKVPRDPQRRGHPAQLHVGHHGLFEGSDAHGEQPHGQRKFRPRHGQHADRHPLFPQRADARCRSCRWPTPTAARSISFRRWPSAGTSPCWVKSRRPRSCWKPCPWSSRRSSAAYR